MSAGVRYVCAWDALDRARQIARPMSAEGAVNVGISTGHTGLEDLVNPERGPEVLVVVWSKNGASSPFIWRWIAEGKPIAIIEIEATKGAAPDLEGRTDQPLDFSSWQEGDRVSALYRNFQNRVNTALRGKPPPPRLRKVSGYVLAGIAASGVVVSTTMRLMDDGPTRTAAAAPTESFETVSQDSVGGPLGDPIEPDDFVRGRGYSARPLPPAPEIHDLQTPHLSAPMTFRDGGLINALTRSFRLASDND